MAKSAAASDVGRLKTTNTPSLPLRRSARIIQRAPFRFSDLPPELRDWILALAVEENQPLRLIAGLSGAAKALSQVSRAIRVDAARMFFAGHTFHVIIGYHPRYVHCANDAVRMVAWVKTWGLLASTNIRSLRLLCRGYRYCTHCVSVNPKDRVNPVVYDSRLPCFLTTRIQECDMTALALAVFCGQSERVPTPEQLGVFINEVEGIVYEYPAEWRASRVARFLSRADEN
jgi:hypothetical protein